MPISWNEIRHNAVAFSKDWAEETREDAEAKTFWGTASGWSIYLGYTRSWRRR